MRVDNQVVQQNQTQIALAQAQTAEELANEAIQQIQAATRVNKEDSALPAIGKHGNTNAS